MNTLVPVITRAGLAAVFNADSDGVSARITHIALGSDGREPSKYEAALTSEKLRIAVADGERVSDTQIHVTGVVDGDVPEFWVREIGFYLEDGTLFAVWSDTDPLAYIKSGVPVLLAFDLVLASLPAGSVTVEGTGANLSLAAWGEQYIGNAAATIDNMARHLSLLFRVQDLEKRL